MKTDIFNSEWCDIVFEGRNQDYGAYLLRKIRPKNSIIAFFSAIAIIILGISAPLIADLISSKLNNNVVKITEVNTLLDPPPIDKKEPPPPPVEPPPPLKNTVKFTPPKIVEDKDVVDTVRAVDELKEVEIGTKTQAGDTSGVDQSLVEGTAAIEDNSNEIFKIVEQMPEFEGGYEVMQKYIISHFRYPQMAKEAGIEGTVFVTFVVDKDGKINNVQILKGLGAGLDQEAIRVVQTMPAWKAGKQNGRPVSVQFNLPIKLKLR